MFDFIEKVVYINLEHRTDRRKQIESELAKYFPEEKILRFDAINTSFSHGGIGCVKSLIGSLELAILNNWNNILIIEDDSMWNNIEKGYSLLETKIKEHFDVIMFGSTCATYSSNFKVNTAQSGNAYLVNKHYYQTLLNNFKEGLEKLETTNKWNLYAIDQYWKNIQKTGNWYCIVPSIMIQRPSYSDIEGSVVDYKTYFSLL
jgi:glycosyl transferase family 25